MGVHRPGGNGHPLKNGAGVAGEEDAVLVGARLSLVGVADDVAHRVVGVVGKLHLTEGGETRATPAPQAGFAHYVNNLLGREGEGFPQALIAASVHIVLGLGGPDFPPVFQQHMQLFHYSTSSRI